MIKIRLGLPLSVCLVFVQSAIGQSTPYDPTKMYSADALKADLKFIREKLERVHPALYRYTSKPDFDAFFDSLEHTIVRPLSEQQYFSLLSLLHAKIKDGHTMFLPSGGAMDYDNTKGRFLPFSIFIIGGKFFILQNFSYDSTIKPGEEILNINGISTPIIISELMIRQIRDGNNRTYPEWILNHYFAAYYSFAFGQPDTFLMEFKNTKGESYEKQVTAITKDSIKLFRNKQTDENKGITLERLGNAAAVLKIKSLDPDLLTESYHQNYKIAMDSVFKMLKQNHTTNLILDLRDNQGGDFQPARLLLSYLILHHSRFLMSGNQSQLIQPKANHFTGKLFILMNGGSFSATAIVISILEGDKRGTTIGEETGGNKHIISGDPEEQILPATRIRCFISTVNYRITPGINDGHGIFPTHPVHPTIVDIINGNDIAKAIALNLILKN